MKYEYINTMKYEYINTENMISEVVSPAQLMALKACLVKWTEDQDEYIDFEEANHLESLYESKKELDKIINQIKTLWKGVYVFGRECLTPEILSTLNTQCEDWSARLQAHELMLSESGDCNVTPYVYPTKELVFYCAIVEAIVLSYEWSSENLNESPTVSTDMFMQLEYDLQPLCYPVKVTPWHAPKCPDMPEIENPMVVLEVLKIFSNNTIAAGLYDVFLPQTLVDEVNVDETLKIGDKIILSVERYDVLRKKLVGVEYSGKSEYECPVANEEYLLSLKNSKNKNLKQWQQEHYLEWLHKHWSVVEPKTLKKIGKGWKTI